MKKIFGFLFLAATLISTAACAQQDKSKRPSPPAKATATLSSGAVITIDYSQPAVKGRTIGKNIEPMAGKIWRTGANEATIFETSKDIIVEGKALKAGKYAFFTIWNGDNWTLIFNNKANQWGAYDYKEADDALRVEVKGGKGTNDAERLVFNASNDGKISFAWGELLVGFTVK
jgi:Protein of unknown function (DUF2911)